MQLLLTQNDMIIQSLQLFFNQWETSGCETGGGGTERTGHLEPLNKTPQRLRWDVCSQPQVNNGGGGVPTIPLF